MRHSPRMKLRLLVAVVALPVWAFVLSAPAVAQDPADPAGLWNGAIKIPGPALKVEVTLKRDGGAWTGSIDIPQQGADDLPLEKISVDGAAVKFTISDTPGNPTFDGKLSADGAKLEGKFKQSGMTFPFQLARGAAAAAAESKPAAATFEPDEFDKWCEEARAAWGTPGLAVAVVRKGKPDFVRGFGMRDVDGNKPVGPDTLFAIGSSSKAFTTFLLATLVEEGKLAWDEPVRKFAPEFRLKDDATSERVTPRDLVTHATGLPRHEFVWYGAREKSRAELVAALRHLDATHDLRAAWQYNNLGYAAAGWLAEKVAGKPWEALVAERIFAPLGMTRANTSIAALAADADAALGYGEEDGKTVLRPYRNIDAIGPAGSINASAADMAKWAVLHLSGGKAGDVRLVPSAAVSDLHKPRILMPTDGDDEVTGTLGYASGWFAKLYRGKRMSEHGGNIDGFTAAVALFPEAGFGVVALANKDADALPALVVRHAADRVLGAAPRDWSGESLAKRDAMKAVSAEAKKKAGTTRREGTAPSRPLDEFVGDYAHPAYGKVRVARDGDALTVDLHGLKGTLEHWHFDVFRVRKDGADPAVAETKYQFRANLDGEIDELVAPLELTLPPIVFGRLPDAALSDPAYLARFVGAYELGPETVTIELNRTTLFAKIAGQPRYELLPKRADTFSLKGLSGYSVRFKSADGAPASAALLMQPDGVHEMTRAKAK